MVSGVAISNSIPMLTRKEIISGLKQGERIMLDPRALGMNVVVPLESALKGLVNSLDFVKSWKGSCLGNE